MTVDSFYPSFIAVDLSVRCFEKKVCPKMGNMTVKERQKQIKISERHFDDVVLNLRLVP